MAQKEIYNENMDFPNTWEEYEKFYGFLDTYEIYTNKARLIPSFRVKQWLDHLSIQRIGEWIDRGKLDDMCEDHVYECSKCHAIHYGTAKFCFNCGRKMKRITTFLEISSSEEKGQ